MYCVKQNIKGVEQRIVVIGDADYFSTKYLTANRVAIRNANFNVLNQLFYTFLAVYFLSM